MKPVAFVLRVAVISFCFFTSFISAATYSGGSGTTVDPYQISSVADMQTLAATSNDWGYSYILTTSLNMQGIILAPIGNNGIPYSGSFNGNRNVIYNAVVSTTSTRSGLFGAVGYTGVIYNLGLESASVTGRTYVGALAGYNYGIIDQCYATGTAASTSTTAATYVGGLVGYNDIGSSVNGIISNCYAMVAVNGTYTTSYVGGLAGYNYYGTISNSYSTGTAAGGSYTGGFLGRNSGTVTNCFWDTQASGLGTGVGRGDATTVYGLNTAGMKTLSSFTTKGWDFVGETVNGDVDLWRICVDLVDYPRLNWGYFKNGDFICSNGVDINDLLVLGQDWLITYTTALSGADANGDKVVDLNDFNILALHWLSGI